MTQDPGSGAAIDAAPSDDPFAEMRESRDAGQTPAGAKEAPAGATRVSGWTRVFRGNRALWLTVAVAVVSLVCGLLLGSVVVPPADAAGDVPDSGLITVPVEFGELSNDVTLRGEVGYADAVEVTLTASELADAAVVTGHVPEVGAELSARSIALEIAGRPVIVLPGELPSYRSLRIGMSGPDVQQLKQALAAAGLDAGDLSSDVFDEATASAVGRLYADAGYSAPVEEGSGDAVRAAQEAVRQADQAVAQARAQLAQAGAGPSAATRREWDNRVAETQRQLDAARAADPPNPLEIARLQDELVLVGLQRDEALKAGDASGERAAVDGAEAQRRAASEDLAAARRAALPFLPASEVLYLTQLPRRVDAVNVHRGSIVSGAAMSVSGATVELTGSAADADAKLLVVGAEASFDLPDGTVARAVIDAVEPDASGGRATIRLVPDPLTPEQLQQVQGANVRVRIPVGATEGDVLSVPFAALTAGPGGESRVEVVEGDPRDGERAETRLVVVETGLAAGGYVEVRPVDGELEKGDLVVVGQ